MAEPRLSPGWWRDRLLEQWEVEQTERRRLLSYYDSTHPLPVNLPKFRQPYVDMLRLARTPWARLVVDTTAERITAQGFRIDTQAPDAAVWQMFQRSRMDHLQRQVHREALITGAGYVSVWPDEAGNPRMMPESSLQVAHETAPGDMDTVVAAIKVWPDSVQEVWRLDLFLADGIYRYWAPWSKYGQVVPKGAVWVEMDAVANAAGAVPIVPFVVRRDWNGYGRSELADLVPLINRFEVLTSDLLVASSYGAFKQRWATGLEIPVDPETGEEVEPFNAAVDRLWISESEQTRFGSMDATDLGPIVRTIDNVVAQISAVSRIPSSYFVQSELANPPSADSLEASEVNLISKIRERQDAFGAGWEQAVAYSLRILGDPRADIARIETIWKDPRSRSEAQVLDSATKMASVGIPQEAIWEYIGFSPTEIERLRAMRATDLLARLATGGNLGAATTGAVV
jgi:Phage portal protein, SPP1 Gp6-like